MPDQEREIIIPRYKVIVLYDVLPSNHESYFQFVMSELVPSLQEMNVYMTEAWHTAYGDYPLRMAIFVAEDIGTIWSMLDSDRWQELESRFQSYVRNYSLKVVKYRRGFQFIR
jgi:hypothetical protein